jgi:hypothetical protein
VECLLLDLVSASLSRRVTNLAGSTASATADAITSLGSTLARLARQGVGLPAGEAEAISPAIGGGAFFFGDQHCLFDFPLLCSAPLECHSCQPRQCSSDTQPC